MARIMAARKRERGRERNSFIFDTDSGKLISERIYYDQAGVVEQMQGKQRSAVA